MKLFLHRPITNIPTAMGLFSGIFTLLYSLFVILAAAFASLASQLFNKESLLLMAAVVVLVPPTLAFIERGRLKRHSKALEAYALAHKYSFYPEELVASTETVLGSVATVHDARDPKALTAVVGDDWTYCDAAYDIYQKSRGGETKVRRVYYGIMATTLPRTVPHVFFDSIKARKQQFRFEFARSQKYSFEGDFDASFVTYMPDDYKIDALSFIGPDVMLALQAAADYDIEIIGNHILLLGALDTPEVQLPDMAAKLAAIKQEPINGINVYRDERLPYAQGRNMVAGAGMQLKGSRLWFYMGLVGPIILIVYFVFGFLQNVFNAARTLGG